MQIVPGVDLTIDNYGKHAAPGDILTGTVSITTEHRTTINSIHLELKGVISYPKGTGHSQHCIQGYGSSGVDNETSKAQQRPGGPLDAENKNKGQQHDDEHQKNKKSKGIGGFTISFGDVEHTKSDHYANYTEPSIHRAKLEFARPDDLIVLASPIEINAGVTSYNFSFRVPVSDKGQPLIPTMEFRRNQLEVYYELSAVVKVPAPMVSFLSIPVKSGQKIIISNKFPNLPIQTFVDHTNSVTAETVARVGFWNEESRGLLQLARYAIGLDTTASWTDAVVKAEVQSIILDTKPTNLEDWIRISVVLPEKPDVVSLISFADEKGDSDGDKGISEVSYTTDRNKSQIRVSSLGISLLTSLTVASFTKHGKTMWMETTLMDPKNYSSNTILEEKNTDITNLIRGATLPSEVPPTVLHTDFLVAHWLKIDVELQSISRDGTRQVASPAELKIPVMIQSPEK